MLFVNKFPKKMFAFLIAVIISLLTTCVVTQTTPNTNSICMDKLTCSAYDKQYCQGKYSSWAHENCPNYCGFCIGTTTPVTPCSDKIKNCIAYRHTVCADPKYTGWVEENCKYFCRQCTDPELALADSLTTTTTTTLPTTTTVAPENCVDKLDCKIFGKTSCVGKYEMFARQSCMNYCGYCKGIPTPPPVCVDTIPNCHTYSKSTCSNSEYQKWSEQYCKKYCGLCDASAGR